MRDRSVHSLSGESLPEGGRRDCQTTAGVVREKQCPVVGDKSRAMDNNGYLTRDQCEVTILPALCQKQSNIAKKNCRKTGGKRVTGNKKKTERGNKKKGGLDRLRISELIEEVSFC